MQEKLYFCTVEMQQIKTTLYHAWFGLTHYQILSKLQEVLMKSRKKIKNETFMKAGNHHQVSLTEVCFDIFSYAAPKMKNF